MKRRHVGMGALALAGLATACGPKRIPGTNLSDTPDNQEILQVVDRYKDAFERRDAPAVLDLVSKRFYETNGTPDPADDYDYDGLSHSLDDYFRMVSHPALDIDVRKIEVHEDDAVINIYFSSRFQLADAGPASGFKRSDDVAQIHMVREGGRWRITSGI